ncbi:MAG: hypothetical protein M5U28_07710 [Sandaracinaceae bacterium]|nr:hypothetical protein [Sandaracinaceae bacterium]
MTNGSQENAFRHTYGQAMIASRWGRTAAEEIGWAHEDRPDIDTTRRVFRDENPAEALFQADTVADQLNNEIGRRLADANPHASFREMALIVLEAYHRDGLYTATTHEDGSVTIARERLTDEQYESARDQVVQMNERAEAADAAEAERAQGRSENPANGR